MVLAHNHGAHRRSQNIRSRIESIHRSLPIARCCDPPHCAPALWHENWFGPIVPRSAARSCSLRWRGTAGVEAAARGGVSPPGGSPAGKLARQGHSSGVSGAPRDASMCLEVGTGRAGGHHQMSAVSAGAHWVDVRADPSPAGSVGGRAGHEASSNQSSPCGGSRAGANVVGVHGRPCAASTARARPESTTTAITLRRPPHGHDSASVANLNWTQRGEDHDQTKCDAEPG